MHAHQQDHLHSQFFVLLVLTLLAVSDRAAGGDWPQILGPHRNGRAVDEPGIGPWPPSGPRVAWSAQVGSGFAGPAVVDGKVLIVHRIRDTLRLDCLDAADGRTHWKRDLPARYRGGVNSDTGPRCVPLVHRDRIYLFSAVGQLHCVRLRDGKPLWSRDAYGEYRGDEGYFGAGSTPIVADGKLIVNVGGRNAGLVAFNLQSGKTVWTATQEKASYSSPTTVTIDGRQLVFFVTRLTALAVDPRDGSVAFDFAFGKRGPTVNAATPLICDGYLFVSAAYGVGARFARLRTDGAQTVWQNDEVMSSQYSTCVYDRGYLYGTHGREDFNNGELRCLEAQTGRVQWKVPRSGVGHVTLVGDKLLMLNNRGQLRLVEAQPGEYKELAQARVSSNTTRALPAISNGRFYFRENETPQSELRCLVLSE